MNPNGPARRDGIDETLLEWGLRMTPADRLRWLEDTVEELLPWLGLAAPAGGSGAAGRDRNPGSG